MTERKACNASSTVSQGAAGDELGVSVFTCLTVYRGVRLDALQESVSAGTNCQRLIIRPKLHLIVECKPRRGSKPAVGEESEQSRIRPAHLGVDVLDAQRGEVDE